jgi:hypothetical protein
MKPKQWLHFSVPHIEGVPLRAKPSMSRALSMPDSLPAALTRFAPSPSIAPDLIFPFLPCLLPIPLLLAMSLPGYNKLQLSEALDSSAATLIQLVIDAIKSGQKKVSDR